MCGSCWGKISHGRNLAGLRKVQITRMPQALRCILYEEISILEFLHPPSNFTDSVVDREHAGHVAFDVLPPETEAETDSHGSSGQGAARTNSHASRTAGQSYAGLADLQNNRIIAVSQSSFTPTAKSLVSATDKRAITPHVSVRSP